MSNTAQEAPRDAQNVQGKQIIRFRLVMVPIVTVVSGFFPWLHAIGFFAATWAKSPYSRADSARFSLGDCFLCARSPFSYMA